MSYDLAVWEGDPPADDEAAVEEFEVLYRRYVGAPVAKLPPTPRIAAYVTALLARYPDISTEDGYHDSPWASAPLMSEACGPFGYFPMVSRRGDEVSVWAAEVAEEHGLVCFDPQLDELRTPWGRPWRFEFTSVFGDRHRNPEPDLVRDVLAQLTAEECSARLTRADGRYVQAGCDERSGWQVIEGPDGNRTEVAGPDEVARAFVDFLGSVPTVTS